MEKKNSYGFVYFNSSGFKRLNIQNDFVETVYPHDMDYVNFAGDSILFARGKKYIWRRVGRRTKEKY
ncbi:MAG: hypothetical protein J1E62_00680 [Lachnospiraceae bacterium]|nr:hypothetical protein [Lachnospiraceae bacterium]